MIEIFEPESEPVSEKFGQPENPDKPEIVELPLSLLLTSPKTIYWCLLQL